MKLYAWASPDFVAALYPRPSPIVAVQFCRFFCVFLSLFLCKHGPAVTSEQLDKVQPGIIYMLLQQVRGDQALCKQTVLQRCRKALKVHLKLCARILLGQVPRCCRQGLAKERHPLKKLSSIAKMVCLDRLLQVWLPTMTGIEGAEEEKLAVVAGARLLTELPGFSAGGPQGALWAQMREALVKKVTGAAAGAGGAGGQEEEEPDFEEMQVGVAVWGKVKVGQGGPALAGCAASSALGCMGTKNKGPYSRASQFARCR